MQSVTFSRCPSGGRNLYRLPFVLCLSQARPQRLDDLSRISVQRRRNVRGVRLLSPREAARLGFVPLAADGAEGTQLVRRRAGLFALEQCACAAKIALSESLVDSRNNRPVRRIGDAAGALAPARCGVTVHYAGRVGLGLGNDRGQTWRRRDRRNRLLRQRRRPAEAKNQHTCGEP